MRTLFRIMMMSHFGCWMLNPVSSLYSKSVLMPGFYGIEVKAAVVFLSWVRVLIARWQNIMVQLGFHFQLRNMKLISAGSEFILHLTATFLPVAGRRTVSLCQTLVPLIL